MSKIFRHVLMLYSIIVAGILLFQFYIRLKQCTGAADCVISSVKGVVWSVIWPVYWPIYLSGL